MKKRVWSDPEKQWDGFKLARYSLDAHKVAALSITERRQVDGRQQDTPTTLEELFGRLRDKKVEIEEEFLSTKLTVNNEQLLFAEPSFSQHLLMEILRLRHEGIEPFDSEWYFFDHDSCREEPLDNYSFFVVFKDKIVRERVAFSDYHGSGFDPDVFRTDDFSDAIWFNDRAWAEARVRLCYKRFYSETKIGQLMLLRNDSPEVFDARNSIASPEHLLLANLFAHVRKIQAALWVLIALAVLTLFRLWK